MMYYIEMNNMIIITNNQHSECEVTYSAQAGVVEPFKKQ